MKKSLLVTLADESYIECAKQLFASVYFNSGWKGDYMLLAHEIPEKKLKWFRDKGILIKKCRALHDKKVRPLHLIFLSKSYLFKPEFKRWDNIIYLDGDIIVRASLEDLTEIKGFAAVREIFNNYLNTQFKLKKGLKQFKKHYDLKAPIFSAGVMAFSTDIIKKDTFAKLKRLLEQYKYFSRSGDQGIFNLFFYKKWKKIPMAYNAWTPPPDNKCNALVRLFFTNSEKRIKAIILHFAHPIKPWEKENPFYKEWKANLEKADSINLSKRLPPIKRWSKREIGMYSAFLATRLSPALISAKLRNNFPRLYLTLKKASKMLR